MLRMKLIVSLKTDSLALLPQCVSSFSSIHGWRHVESREESFSGSAKKNSVDKGIQSLTNLP